MSNLHFSTKKQWLSIALFGILLGFALLIGLNNVQESGPIWPDASRYANGAAMIHDWLLSGRIFHPYEFAKENYRQYPGFSIPYHPPVYPGLMGLVFVATGVSYLAARCFIALCLGVSAWLFFGIMRKLGASRWGAFIGSLLLLFTPEIALWSRDTMSEIPALMLILGGSYIFLKSLDLNKPSLCWAAIGMAQLSFLSRMTTAGVIPSWYLAGLWMRKMQKSILRHMIQAGIFYLGIGIAWIWFVSGYAKYEILENFASTRVAHLSWENFCFYLSRLPEMAGWGLILTALMGVVSWMFLGKMRNQNPTPLFWITWFLSYFLFQLVLAINEQRYFLFALPSLAGLAAYALHKDVPKLISRGVAPVLITVLMIINAFEIAGQPRGIVGFDRVAQTLSRIETPGNVLLVCYRDSEFIFQYRAMNPKIQRTLIRGDRTLAIRLSNYAGVEPRIIVDDLEGFLEIIKKGRIRYLLTCIPASGSREDRAKEMILAHNLAKSNPDKFRLIEQFPLLWQRPEKSVGLFLWEYLGDLPSGKSELKVIIPTADLEL